ncbi:MAG: hypothetical protein DI536_08760 [Archangium gephyra]|uniref:Dickkopf N-terminal cysteine-rich domain-containing protein n=1 Tax=Archangium gephyra TaxID=48 RepID=A0A2W5TJ06_9BACT|nr:MAG: hypothetical protein DI536_08760 [Archangium gephyra]
MSRWSALSLVLLAGCEGLPAESYCREVTRAECEASKRCGLLSQSVDCARPLVSYDCLFQYRAALDAGTLEYDPKAGQKCVDDVRASTQCIGGRFVIPSCRDVLVGQGAEGEPCGTCGAGLACVRNSTTDCGVCTRVDTPTLIPSKRGEPCVSPQVDGIGCELDSWCGAADGGSVCLPRAALGEGCMTSTCVLGAWCKEGVCAPLTAFGQACSDASCEGGLTCVDGTCDMPLGVGVGCSANSECASGLCLDGTCAVGRPLKSPCSEEAPCQPGLHCVEGTCAPLPVHGEACSGQCGALGQCIDGVCFDATLQVCR